MNTNKLTIPFAVLLLAAGANVRAQATHQEQSQENKSTSPLRAEPLKLSVRAGLETEVEILTTPNASCFLHPETGGEAGHRLHLDADDEGVVRLHAKPKAASVIATPLALSCTARNGRKASYPVEFQAVATSGQVTPHGPRPAAKGIALRQIQPEELTQLSSQELVARGYPPRPDAISAPGAYAKWVKLVSRPFTEVSHTRVAHEEVRHTPQNMLLKAPGGLANSPTLPVPPPGSRFTNNISFNIWSGGYMTNPPVRYWDVQANWTVPTVQDVPVYLSYAAAAEWVGLDNAGNDLVQSGTDSEAFHYSFFGQDWTFTNYSVWIESLPAAAYFLPNFPASPGDEISVTIFVADQNGSTTFSNGDLTPSDDTIWFMIYNLSTNNSYWGTLPKPAAFSGSTVDFIVEAPNINGSTANLADFGIAGMHGCWFADSWAGFSSLDYNGSDPSIGTLNDVTMVNFGDGNTLASAYIYANFDTPGGGNIMWVWQNYN